MGKAQRDAAEREVAAALEINPNLAVAYYAQGLINRTKGDHEAALKSFQRSLEIDPNNARAIAQAGAEQLYLGRAREALSEIKRALEVNPGHPSSGMFRWIGARALFFDERYEESIPWLQESIKSWPDLWYNRAYEVSVYALKGDEEIARRKLADFERRFPDLKTIALIVEAEKANPNNHPLIIEGRRKFHKGLRIAGMAEA